MARPTHYAAILVAGSLLGGCAISDIGEVDARKGILAPSERTARAEVREGAFGPETERPLEDLRPEAGGACTARASSRNLTGLARPRRANEILKPDDMVSIRLRKAYISDQAITPENVLTEIGLSAESLGETSRYFYDLTHNLEILVAARVFDYGDEAGFRFGPGARDKALVIFFSDDVQEGQFLNFDNLPVYGPRRYSGAGMGLQLFILELDTVSQEQKALLTSLASIGKASSTAAAPVLDVLGRLANALLDNGNQDDRMFDYAIGFDTGFEGAAVDYVPFEENLYAFVVDHDRKRRVPWHRLALNAETAELYECTDTAGWQIFRGSTYMIVEVLKGFGGQAEAGLTFEEVSELRDALVANREPGVSVGQAVARLAPVLEGDARYREARGLLGDLREGLAAGERNRVNRALFRLASLIVEHHPRRPRGQDQAAARFTARQLDYLLETLYGMVQRPVPLAEQPLFTAQGVPANAANYANALMPFYMVTR